MIIQLILLIFGIFLLIKGADFLIDGSSLIAKKFGVSTLMLGLTIVAFGTSMPELVVNVLAALKGENMIALGNVIGSNMANILLVLGVVACIKPIRIKSSTIWIQIPFSFLGVFVLFVLCNETFFNGVSSSGIYRSGGILLLSFFVVFLIYTFIIAKRGKMGKREEMLYEGVVEERFNLFRSLIYIIGGLVALYFGGVWVVDSVIFFAKNLGLSDYVISATVIAVGTSLPELVTGISAAKKKNIDLAVGNSIGSNILNIFWVLGVSLLFAPILIPASINLELMFLMGSTLLLFLFMFIGKKKVLKRWQGIVLILVYILYVVNLIFRLGG